MDNTLNRRLVMLREVFAGKRGQRRFAQMVGIKQQSISNYERGSMPSANVLAKIVLVTGVSAEWLLTGRGPMFSDSARKEQYRDKTRGPNWVDENGEGVTVRKMAELLEVSEARARSFTESLEHSSIGRDRMPIVLRRPDGRICVLHPRPVPSEEFERQLTLELTESEIQLSVPEPLLKSRAVRIIPIRPDVD
ncbi:MAG: helix-turn-helix domain-containing protein [Planctomycetota bacterium]